MWISPEFKVYLIREFQRLKDEEQKQLGWTAKRELSKINYRIHTDAIKQNLIPEEVTASQASIIYAEEADVLNVAMFGQTALVNAVDVGRHGKEHRVLPVATLLDGVEVLQLLVGFRFEFGHFLSLGFNGIIKRLGAFRLVPDVKVETVAALCFHQRRRIRQSLSGPSSSCGFNELCFWSETVC